MISKPIPPVGRVMIEGMQGSKKEQRVNDALFLNGLADYFEDNNIHYNEAIKLREIADRLEKKKKKLVKEFIV